MDVRAFVGPTYQPAAMAASFFAPLNQTERANVRVVSLGDEIAVGPDPTAVTNRTFGVWCAAKGITEDQVGCAVGWASCKWAPTRAVVRRNNL